MRRRRRFYNEDRRDNILLAEFKFYNKTKKVLDNDILKEMENRLLNGERQIYWTNDIFAKNGIGFKFTSIMTDLSGKEQTNIYVTILEFDGIKLTASAFNKCKWIYNKKIFIGYDLNTLQKEMIEHIVDNWSSSLGKSLTVTKPLMSWEETVEFMIVNKMIGKYEIESDWDEYIKDINLLFGEDAFKDYECKTEVTGKPQKTKYQIIGRSYSAPNTYHILSVIERRINNTNYRIALITIIHDYYPEFAIKVFDDKDDDYLFIDAGKMFFQAEGNEFYYLDDSIREYGNEGMIINREVYKAMKRNIKEILPEGERIINPNIYRFYKERAVRFENDRDDYGKDGKEEKIIMQYKKLLEQDRTVKLHDTTINKNTIEVNGERFKIEFNNDFLNVVGNFGHIKQLLNNNDVRYNFNELYEKILKLSVLRYVRMDYTKEDEYKSFKEVRFKVNGMEINVHKDGNRMKINGIFSRINDVYHILTKVICYDDINEFNRYVKEVSYIGIEWKQMISNGIGIELSNPFYSIFRRTGDSSLEKMYLRFSLLWDSVRRQQVYLLLNEKKYLIKYKGKFKYYFNLPHRVINMSELKKELSQCVQELDDDIIIEIVENAVEEAKIIKKRGEELVTNTLTDVNAEETEIVISGNTVSGYKFKGRKTGTEYFIEKVNLNVFRNDGGNWNRRCIVDDHRKQRIFEDKLSNRLINIYNEPVYLENYLGDR